MDGDRNYWLVLSTPARSTSEADLQRHLPAHLAWVLALEAEGVLFLSGPLTEGPEVGPGSGVTVLRADSAARAAVIAAADPFVTAGLRTFQVFGWCVKEGALRISTSLGSGTFAWD